ncbi:hypothetical protein IJ596_04105 [bacterium]|nr:hypothetical protein [bacterium]
MISALGKVGTYFTRGAKAVKPYIKTVSTVIKSLPKDMVTLSTSAKKVAKAPKNILKALWKVCRPVLKWTIAAGILAYRAGKGVVKAAGKVLNKLVSVIKK